MSDPILPKDLSPQQRNVVRAVIFKQDAVLMQCKIYDDGSTVYMLPGGAPDVGESLEQGLIRECEEEIGAIVEVKSLRYVAEIYKPRRTIPQTWRHQIEFLFDCNIDEAYLPHNGPHPDKNQRDILWVPVMEMNNLTVFPVKLSEIISSHAVQLPCYLGQVE